MGSAPSDASEVLASQVANYMPECLSTQSRQVLGRTGREPLSVYGGSDLRPALSLSKGIATPFAFSPSPMRLLAVARRGARGEASWACVEGEMTEQAILIGLMSGTSTDGIDAAAVRLTERAGLLSTELLAFLTVPYSDEVRRRLLSLAGNTGAPADIARANFLLGELLAEAAARVMEIAGLMADDVTAIGSSGHTIAHVPRPGGPLEPPATMQIGEAAVIAERLGATVVSDFRVRDIAAGGQGAPLVPYFDFRMLRSEDVNRAVLNIGGIANATVLRAACELEDVVAFDTGPGNMPIDIAVGMLLPGHCGFDQDGEIANSGVIDEDLLSWLMGHEYFAKPPPKSCGREEFGEVFVSAARERAPGLPAEDLVATVTAASGRATGEAIAAFRESEGETWEIIASGGGVRNPCLLHAVAEYAGAPVTPSDDLGIPSDAKEAMAFACLAWETVRGRASNVPSATGARGPRILGKITSP